MEPDKLHPQLLSSLLIQAYAHTSAHTHKHRHLKQKPVRVSSGLSMKKEVALCVRTLKGSLMCIKERRPVMRLISELIIM